MITKNAFWMLALVSMHALFACSNDDGGDEGAAPKVADLELTPKEVTVGKTSTLAGNVTIDDPDGDVVQIGVDVTLPDGTKQSLPKTDARGASGTKTGQLAIALVFGPPLAGDYELEFFVVDSKGHESNRLGTTVNAK